MKYKIVESQFSKIEEKNFTVEETGEQRRMIKFQVWRRGDGFIPVVCYKEELFEFIKKDNEIDVIEWRPKQTNFVGKDGKKHNYFQMIIEKFVLANEVEVQAKHETKPVEIDATKMSDEELDDIWGDLD